MMDKNNHSKNNPQPLYNWIGTILSVIVVIVGATVYFTTIRHNIETVNQGIGELTKRIDAIEEMLKPGDKPVEPVTRSPLKTFTNEGKWGKWSDPVYCDLGQYVCGLQQKVEEDQGGGINGGDDSAMNAVAFFCCSLP